MDFIPSDVSIKIYNTVPTFSHVLAACQFQITEQAVIHCDITMP